MRCTCTSSCCPMSWAWIRSWMSLMTRMTPAMRCCAIPSISSGSARTSATPSSGRRSTPRGRPWGGFLKNPKQTDFPDLVARLEAIRPKVLRGIDTFLGWGVSLVRNTDYLGLRNDTGEDYLVGALARINLNRDLLHPRTKADAAFALSAFPSNNVYHNNLAQAIEVLHCVDDAIDVSRTMELADEQPIRAQSQAGTGVGLIEAPRGLLYHMAKINEDGIVEDYDVIVPTAQNQINIENDLKDYFDENLDKDEETLRADAESIVRAYDPCMSCATNFLKMDLIRR